jgi:predicted Zn-dependent protease
VPLRIGLALARGLSLISVPEEIAIGKAADRQVRKEMPVLHDAATTAYVAKLGRRLAASARGPKYPYRFAVVNQADINAFALPGGAVWINRGALQAATNESQVAGVIAHEIAHVAQRHAAAQLTKSMIANWGIGFLGAILGNTGGASAAQVAAGVMANGAFLKFTRDDEREADRVGLEIMTRAGWDGRGMVEMFEILQRKTADNPGAVQVFLSSHPAPADRIRLLRQQRASARRGIRDSRAFESIRARLRALPPAPRVPPRS